MKRLTGVCLLLWCAAYPAVCQDRGRVPVLVELFTSEGCSDCPPADRLLEQLDRTQPVPAAEIIVLSEHVDYWNSLGWKDPFSAHEFSLRQEAYARRFRLSDIYTPQMVVDGGEELVGSDSRRAISAIGAAARARKVSVRLSRVPQSVGSAANLRVEMDGGLPGGDIYFVVADNRDQSQVLRGENQGRSLQHVAVVRRMQLLGKWDGRTAFSKDVAAGGPGSRTVVFVQEPGSGRVTSAARLVAPQ